MDDKFLKCPLCNSNKVVPIIYGYPDPEAVKDSQSGRLHLGGCIVEDNQPQKHCKNCGHEWK